MALKVIIAAYAWFALIFYGRDSLPRYGVRGDPLSKKWLTVGLMAFNHGYNGRRFDEPCPREELFLCIHLPIYGMRYQIQCDEYVWSQDCIYIGATRGLHRFSIPVPPVAAGI